MKTWKLLARHKNWVEGATISESVILKFQRDEIPICRFTATIRGFQNWRIYQGNKWNLKEIIQHVREIRDRIDQKDESVFAEKGAW